MWNPGWRFCVHGAEFCRRCYEKSRGGGLRSQRPYRVTEHWDPLEAEKMAMSRSSGASAAGNKKATVEDPKFKSLYASLHEFLTEHEWDDGKSRKTGTVMILVEDGWWKLWVHDRDGKASAWFTGNCLDDVMSAVEDALDAGSVAWRPDRR